MSSVFIKDSKRTIKGFNGKEYPSHYYLQFVPGYVVEVVHSEESAYYTGPESINTVIALPHIRSEESELFNRRSTINLSDRRYWPLLRTLNDVPSKGDPVLLCSMGKCNYYLGPLNTDNNSPTWNDDPSFQYDEFIEFVDRNKMYLRPDGVSEATMDDIEGTSSEEMYDPALEQEQQIANDRNTYLGRKGQSNTFNRSTSWSRLTKTRKKDLDYGTAFRETTGDTIIEGRHGNSVRIGSRDQNPYVFLSNGRPHLSNREGIGDGSLIAIIQSGSLSQHFGGSTIADFVSGDDSNTLTHYRLESDIQHQEGLIPPSRFMADLIQDVNGGPSVPEALTDTKIYGYSDNQVLIHSDRITLGTRYDDMYLSSNNDIHIGTGRHLTISTNEDLIIESERTYLGNPVPFGESRLMNPMVLGDELINALEAIVDMFTKVKGVSSDGQLPLALPSDFTDLKGLIQRIKSNKHFIEPNN